MRERVTYMSVQGRQLKVWPPKNPDEGYQIADEGGWIDGIYDSEETAVKAFKITFNKGGWDTLSKLSKNINRVDTGNRLITSEDLL